MASMANRFEGINALLKQILDEVHGVKTEVGKVRSAVEAVRGRVEVLEARPGVDQRTTLPGNPPATPVVPTRGVSMGTSSSEEAAERLGLQDQVVGGGDALGVGEDLVVVHATEGAEVVHEGVHVADGLHDVAGTRLALGASHGGGFANATEGLAKVAAAAHAGDAEVVFGDVWASRREPKSDSGQRLEWLFTALNSKEGVRQVFEEMPLRSGILIGFADGQGSKLLMLTPMKKETADVECIQKRSAAATEPELMSYLSLVPPHPLDPPPNSVKAFQPGARQVFDEVPEDNVEDAKVSSGSRPRPAKEKFRLMPLWLPILFPTAHALALRVILQLGVKPSWFECSNAGKLASNSITATPAIFGDLRSYMMETTLPPIGDSVVPEWLLNSILFDPMHSSICVEDGPFIDQASYGSEIASFKDALARIGVTVDVKSGHNLVAQHLTRHKDIVTISRIYMYLMDCNWKPENNTSNWVWILIARESGEWVSSLRCVLHDRDNLFGQEVHVLDNYYDSKLFGFFSLVFGVRHNTSAEDYCKLWHTWENSVSELSGTNCNTFWQFITKNWSKNTEKLLSGCVKVPVCSDGKIILSKKEDVFIPDDLVLKDLFSKLPELSLFVWYPSTSLPSVSRTRLNSIYGSIGVRTISKAVQKNDSFTLGNDSFRTVDLSKVIKVGLLQIVLAFLSDPGLDICAEERHRMFSCLLNVTVIETDEPITVGYSVKLSSGMALSVKASRMLWWERENSMLHMQRCDGAADYKEKIQFATNFAEEISHGLPFEMADQIPSLAELIKIGSLMDFHDAAVEYLLKSKNLQLFPEDVDFLKTRLLGWLPAEYCTCMGNHGRRIIGLGASLISTGGECHGPQGRGLDVAHSLREMTIYKQQATARMGIEQEKQKTQQEHNNIAFHSRALRSALSFPA